jgi:hypothetical protein
MCTCTHTHTHIPFAVDAFASEIKDILQGGAQATSFREVMPQELPVDTALIASNSNNHALALSMLDVILHARSRDRSQPSEMARTHEALEAHIRSCMALKRQPMRLEEMQGHGLTPTKPTSELWSLSVTAHSLAEDPRAAFEIIEYLSANFGATVGAYAEADTCASAVCNGLVLMCTRRLETLSEQAGGISIGFCNDILAKILRSAGGRLDMGSWADVMRVMHSCGADFDVETHKLTLYAALAARNLVMCRYASICTCLYAQTGTDVMYDIVCMSLCICICRPEAL